MREAIRLGYFTVAEIFIVDDENGWVERGELKLTQAARVQDKVFIPAQSITITDSELEALYHELKRRIEAIEKPMR